MDGHRLAALLPSPCGGWRSLYFALTAESVGQIGSSAAPEVVAVVAAVDLVAAPVVAVLVAVAADPAVDLAGLDSAGPSSVPAPAF